MFSHRHATRRNDEARAGRHIEGSLGVAAGADNIDGVGWRFDRVRFGPHDPRCAGDLVHGLTAHAQRHQKGANLRRRGVTRHDDIEGRLGLALVERLPAGDQPNQFFQIAHVTTGFASHNATISPARPSVP